MATQDDHVGTPAPEVWVSWPVSWSAVWVGALAALAALTVFGLTGVVLKLHVTGTSGRIDDWHKIGMGTVVCSILSAFFAFVIGAWVAGKIGGFRRSEPAMLHGAIVWLVAVPLLLGVVTLGGSSAVGSWYSGMGGKPVWATTPAAVAPTDPEEARRLVELEARAARNAALAAVTSLLLGLVGSVLGGWMASGEPMTLRHHLHRDKRANQLHLGERNKATVSV